MPSTSRVVPAEHLYAGIKGRVVAIRRHDGTIAWSTKLSRGSSFVPIIQDGDRLFAASGGEVTCLDCATGSVIWHNPMKGYGTGYTALAGAGFPISAAAAEEAARRAAMVAAT